LQQQSGDRKSQSIHGELDMYASHKYKKGIGREDVEDYRETMSEGK
jgi:hypothetical protein